MLTLGGICLQQTVIYLLRFRLNAYSRRAFNSLASSIAYGLELTNFTAGPIDQYRLFQTCAENLFVHSIP